MTRVPARRWVQALLLGAFLALFARTGYRGADLVDWPVHLVFLLDPLAALAAFLSIGPAALSWAWLGAGLLLAFTAVLGRFFCGWACPLGTVLDLAGGTLRRAAGREAKQRRRPPRSLAVSLFAGLVAAAVVGLPLLGLLDPLSLLLRTLTLSIHPLADAGAKAAIGRLGSSEVLPVAELGDRLYRWAEPALAYGRPSFLLAGFTAAVFAAVAALELLAPRFWCSHLCPLGALLGLTARASPVSRRRSSRCGPCRRCETACPSGAAGEGEEADRSLCLQCGSCARACPQGARAAVLAGARPAAAVLPGRRALLAAGGAGALLALAPRVRGEERELAWDFLRPPGATPEDEFRERCIRCGACMRVCPGGALHPALLEAGLEGLWTPRLVARLGYCEYHCRLCGQVCPTGAIGYLEAGAKEKAVIGLAVFDRDRCLPYRKAENCMVCEEHCPTNPKAIVFRDEVFADPLGRPRTVKAPRVVEDRCIGCGICETKCPIPGQAAIRVAREKPSDLSVFY